MAGERQTEVYGYGPCGKCGHGARSHSSRSGLCKIDSCQCEMFDGPGPQPWEIEDPIEDPIDYEYGARALAQAKQSAPARPGFTFKRDTIQQLPNGYWNAAILFRAPDDSTPIEWKCFRDRAEAEAWVYERRVAYGVEPQDAA